MKFRTAALAALALLAACGPSAEPAAAAPAEASAWEIGPIIRGRNYSEGAALHPTPRRDGSWHIDLPRPPGSVHYVTFPHGSLAGKKRIVMRYRIEAARGVRLAPPSSPTGPALLTLYFQRRGVTWSGRGRYETYRWYATFASHRDLKPGEYEMVAPLDANWTAVEQSTAANNPAAFRAAVADAHRVGFVLGGGDGYGHGVFATGPARIVVTDFRVE